MNQSLTAHFLSLNFVLILQKILTLTFGNESQRTPFEALPFRRPSTFLRTSPAPGRAISASLY
jgi:hypothetical protein